VGHIGVVDDDAVDVSNLHRQVAHATRRVGWPKAESLISTLSSINPLGTFSAHNMRFTAANGYALVQRHHIVVDCTDNPATRYLINDACVLTGKPLVSGAALGTDGQISVYGYRGGPCYRCLHPEPPPVSTVTSCADAGVLGPVTGVIGSMQALEVLKIAADMGCRGAAPRYGIRPRISAPSFTSGDADTNQAAAPTLLSTADGGEGRDAVGDDACVAWIDAPAPRPMEAADERDPTGAAARPQLAASSTGKRGLGDTLSGRLLVFDGADARVRVVRLRGRRPGCAVCGTAESTATTATACGAAQLAATTAASAVGTSCEPTPIDPSSPRAHLGVIADLADTARWLAARRLVTTEAPRALPLNNATGPGATSALDGDDRGCPCETAGAGTVEKALEHENVSVAVLAAARQRLERHSVLSSTPRFAGIPQEDGGAPVSTADGRSTSENATAPVTDTPVVTASCGMQQTHGRAPIIIDVRSREQFSICSLTGSVNVPLADLKRDCATALAAVGLTVAALALEGRSAESSAPSASCAATEWPHAEGLAAVASSAPCFLLCRRGIDSLEATRVSIAGAVASCQPPRVEGVSLLHGSGLQRGVLVLRHRSACIISTLALKCGRRPGVVWLVVESLGLFFVATVIRAAIASPPPACQSTSLHSLTLPHFPLPCAAAAFGRCKRRGQRGRRPPGLDPGD
jgi:molybdopterin/thiamine biosynthesis adenylyltransferase/rhodanese-related sulfurtransferase